jgi:thioredoxin 1
MLASKLLAVLFIAAAGAVLLGKSFLSQEQPTARETDAGLEQGASKAQPPKPESGGSLALLPAEQRSGPAGQQTTDAKAASPPPAAQPAQSSIVKPLTGNKLSACLRSGKPTLADFGSGWCRECKRHSPVLDQAATAFRDKANVVYVSVEDYADIARRYRVATIPSQIFFDAKGKEASRHIGFMSLEEITKEFTRLGVK